MSENRETILPVRLRESERQLLKAAANLHALPMSTWLRAVGLRQSRCDLEQRRESEES